MSGVLEYSSNNSGGSWWLDDNNWLDLAAAGWDVQWFADEEPGPFSFSRKEGRFLGALAKRATKTFDTPQEGVDEWERVTKQTATSEGCNCCGEPHEFTFKDDATGKTHHLSHLFAAVVSSWGEL